MKPTREEVIRVARECGLYVGENLSGVTLVGSSYNKNCGLLIHLNIEDLESVAYHFYEAGAAAAREPLVEALAQCREALDALWSPADSIYTRASDAADRAIEAKLREKNAGKPATEDTRKQDRWDDVPQDFRDWWNGDYDDSTNPFRLNSSAYWAWAGWKAAEDKAGVDEPVATGTWEHLKLMMEESAWDGKIELADALANIVDFEKYYTRPQPQADDKAGGDAPVAYVDHADGAVIWKGNRLPGGTLLYARPQPQADELVAWVECDGELIWHNREAAIGRNLYTRPQPQGDEP